MTKRNIALTAVLAGVLLLSAAPLTAWSQVDVAKEPMVIKMADVKGLTMLYDIRPLMTMISEGNKNLKPIVIIDVRVPQSYAAGHIEGAINVPGAAITHVKDNKDMLSYVVQDKSKAVVFIDDGVSDDHKATLDGYNTAKFAVGQGYTNVFCYGPGMRMWEFLKLKTVPGAENFLSHMGASDDASTGLEKK